MKLEMTRRSYDTETKTGCVTLSWIEPDFLPVECTGYRIMMDDGQKSDFECVYHGDAAALSTTINNLKLDLFYRLKLQAVTARGHGPYTPVAYLRAGTTHVHVEDMDDNGMINYIGSDMKRKPFENPAHSLKVVASRSSTQIGSANIICGREPLPNCTLNQPRGWYLLDLGPNRAAQVTHYTLVGNCVNNVEQPRGWWFQGSVDQTEWVLLDKRQKDKTISSKGGTGTFQLNVKRPVTPLLRYFRLVSTEKNSSHTHRFHVCGFEMYGVLISDNYGNYTDPKL